MARATFAGSLRAAAQQLHNEAKAQRYRHDPVLWAEEVLGVVLWSKQKEILRSLATNKRTAVKSSHSIGKTFISAVAACWWVSTRGDCMIQSTAPTYHQVHDLLWEEIRKIHTRNDLTGRVNQKDQWVVPYFYEGRTKEGLRGEGKKPADTNIHGFQGTHRPDGVLAILDEACGVATAIFTGADVITTAASDRILAVGNPDDPNTEFGNVFRTGARDWHLITVSAFETPNFTPEGRQMMNWAHRQDKGDPEKTRTNQVIQLLEGLPQRDWVESRKRVWGVDSPRYLSKVLAKFPTASVDSLFTAAEIETGLSCVIHPSDTAFRVLGVDVARYGEDKSVVASNIGGKISIVSVFNTNDTMELAAQVHKIAMEGSYDQVRIDEVGVGGGVIDRVIQLSAAEGRPYVVVGMTANRAAPDPTIHRNARAFWYDSLKHQLRNDLIDLPGGEDGSWGDKLSLELGGIKYTYAGGVLQIESKEDIRRRGEKSPDFVDAVVMATAPINYITSDPLASARKGQIHEIDVLDQIEVVSPY